MRSSHFDDILDWRHQEETLRRGIGIKTIETLPFSPAALERVFGDEVYGWWYVIGIHQGQCHPLTKALTHSELTPALAQVNKIIEAAKSIEKETQPCNSKPFKP